MDKMFDANSSKINFEKFNMDSLVKNELGNYIIPRIVIIGKSGAGTSWLIRDILFNIRKFIGDGVIIAPTDKMSKFYNDIVPENNIYHEYTGKIIRSIIRMRLTCYTGDNL